MSDDSAPDEGIKRKTVSFTHRQLGAGLGVMLAFSSLSQLKEIKEFFVGDTAAAIVRIEANQKVGFERLENLIKDSNAETLIKIRRLKDAEVADVAASEARCDKRITEVRTDVSALQMFAFKSHSSRSIQN